MSRGLPYDSDAGRDYAARDHRADARRGLRRSRRGSRAITAARSPATTEEPRADAARDAQAPRGAQGHRQDARAERSDRSRASRRGTRRSSSGEQLRLPQRAGHGARADRHHRLHDGLRHHRRRARHRAGQVQEAGRRRDDEDRQPDRADGAEEARLHRRSRSTRSSSTSTRTRRSRARRTCKERTCRCSTAPSSRRSGERSIHYMGHIKMMGAAQPFISGAITKTVNVPKDATVEEIEQAYIEAWRLGAKAVAIYRDGCKRTQPLNTSQRQATAPPASWTAAARRSTAPRRRKLPDERAGDHPQVRHRRPRGLHHRRPLRGRHAGRDLPGHGQGRLDDLGLRGRLRAGDQLRAAVRRAAAGRWSTSSATCASSRRA